MNARNAEKGAGDDWTCGKPGCDLGVDGHDFALALEHIFHEENLSAEDARGVVDRTLDRVARAFDLASDPTREGDAHGNAE